MKRLELNQMENIHGEGFFDGLCAGLTLARGGIAIYAIAVGSAVPGANVVLAGALIACGTAAALRA
ncbi:hypothetical protein V1T75_10675 [Tenacibaculum sp. FZY0031]|uniref:hypothetical protein n=1 Tax=unclassified Tenacibaculum TaxID=2635139 RepID=UPI002EA67B57|nr:hypothetical protein [Tenacibaculum sp. FZY0031]